jgi:hypothetical protein
MVEECGFTERVGEMERTSLVQPLAGALWFRVECRGGRYEYREFEFFHLRTLRSSSDLGRQRLPAYSLDSWKGVGILWQHCVF